MKKSEGIKICLLVGHSRVLMKHSIYMIEIPADVANHEVDSEGFMIDTIYPTISVDEHTPEQGLISGSAMIKLGSRIYFFGGEGFPDLEIEEEDPNDIPLDKRVSVRFLDTDHLERGFQFAASLKYPKDAPCVFSANNLIYALDSPCSGNFDCSFERYDPESDQWELLPKPPIKPSSSHCEINWCDCATVVNDRHVFLGNVYEDTNFIFDISTKKWFALYRVTRRNSLSGVKYSEEPAIFAWELINEPRCESSSSAPALENWITEMAAYVKSLDNKHLLTVGLEGFYGFKTTEKSTVNPGKWAASLGSDFIHNSAIENIDFASVHAYPHSWIPLSDLDAKAGFVLSPSGISNIEAMKKFFFQAFATDYYETMAMYARIIIMFLIGLEFDVPYLRRNFKRASAIALGGCVTCTIFAFAITSFIYEETSAEGNHFLMTCMIAVVFFDDLHDCSGILTLS